MIKSVSTPHSLATTEDRHWLLLIVPPLWFLFSYASLRTALHFGHWDWFEPLLFLNFFGVLVAGFCGVRLGVRQAHGRRWPNVAASILLWCLAVAAICAAVLFLIDALPLSIAGP